MDETAVEFEGPSFTDAELKAVPNLDKVEMLALRDTAVTDKGCRELLRAHALVEVSIISDTLSDDVLQVLAQLPVLRSLQIHRGPRIGDDGVRHLSRCAELRELYLKETAVTDKGLMEIHALPQVWSLVLDDTTVSDEGCAALAELQQLSLLGLNRTHVVGYGLAALRDNEHFNVYLEGTPATDEGVIALTERLSNLQHISLSQTSVGDSAARALAKLPRLNDVRLSHTKLTDDGLAAFSGHPHLEAIYVKGCAITERAVKALKKASRHGLTVYGP
jgi:internalin A